MAGLDDFMRTPFEELIKLAAGTLHVNGGQGRVFHLDDIVEARGVMEGHTAGGKIVVLTLVIDPGITKIESMTTSLSINGEVRHVARHSGTVWTNGFQCRFVASVIVAAFD